MKKITTFIVALLASVGVFAQPEAGTFSITPKFGATITSITGNSYQASYKLDKVINTTIEGGITTGCVAGAEASYQVSKLFAVTAGLLFTQQGKERNGYYRGEDLSITDKSKCRLSYLNVPILANVYVVKGLAVKVGIQPGFLLSAKNKYNVDATGLAATFDKHNTVNVKDYFKKVDFSIPVGLSYEFFNVIIDARYNWGLTKINSEKEKVDESCRNSVFQLTVGYKINL